MTPLATDYSRELAALLPREAFRRNPGRVAYAFAQLMIFAASVVLARTFDGWILLPIALLAGHSLFCLALFAHELSHGAVLGPGLPRSALELGCWGANFISPTVWSIVHNHSHHRHANTLRDPDRRFLRREASTSTAIYTALFYPHLQAPTRWNPLVLLHFVPYVLKQTAAALLGASPFGLVPHRPDFSWRKRALVAAEVVVIAGMQLCLCRAVGGGFHYLAVGPGAVCVASALVMTYVFTNHYGDEITPVVDALVGTTSVRVPPLIDRLHLHFSFHTEHHLFPSMDSRYFPGLSALVAERYPDRYKRLSLSRAWSRAFQQPRFSVEARC
ncbi:MAG TPA: fatty acid desaturase [Polyangia bacterium]|jgi:fatty acid desaturase|nr:fatty acid desaturase [Polyangia bacterium]